MNRIHILLLILIVQNSYAQKNILQYIFIGHCYQAESPAYKVDYRIEKMDFSEYDGIWLGGDVSSEATMRYSIVNYIDSLFNLSDELTFWALGNHDTRNGNLEWIRKFTQRESYFAQNKFDITYLVLNTNLVLTDCYNVNKQYNMIKNVCDSISQSSHLILIMHHGIWTGIPGLPDPATYSHSSLPYWNSNCNDVNSNFYNSIYPMLIDVENKGVEVICIMGDMGANGKSFEAETTDGITFLGCGLDKNSPDDLVLIFDHNSILKTLEWKFIKLESLINKQ